MDSSSKNYTSHNAKVALCIGHAGGLSVGPPFSRAYLLRIAHETGTDEVLICGQAHLRARSKHYWHGLLHTYDQAGLPRPNNNLESRFREGDGWYGRRGKRGRRCAGYNGGAGAGKLIAGAGSAAEQGAAFSRVAPGDWEQERAPMGHK